MSFPVSLSQKLITWAKCLTFAILAKTQRKIEEYYPFSKTNLCKNFLREQERESQQLNWCSVLMFGIHKFQCPPWLLLKMTNKLLTVCSCHVTYVFESKSTLYSCLNVKELVAQSRREIWNLSDWSWTRTHNHLVHKQTLNHLAKLTSLAKWSSVYLWTKWLWVRVQLQ